MSRTIYSTTNTHGTHWCIEQQPEGVADPMVISFRRWNRSRSLLNHTARWTGDGWDRIRWVPKPPVVPAGIPVRVDNYMRRQVTA